MIEIREAPPHELEETGAVPARAYEEFFGPDGADTDRSYLDRIRDVPERARRTTILVALQDGRASA